MQLAVFDCDLSAEPKGVVVMSRKKLTERQRRFVEEFALNGNATQAAIRAGFSQKAAKQQGARLLTNVDVAAAIRRLRNAASQRIEISADRVLQGYARIAFDPRPVGELSAQDRIRAMNALGKHLGLFVDKHEVDVGTRLQDSLTQIMSKLRPELQEEFLRVVGEHLAQTVAPAADPAGGEPEGSDQSG